MNITENIKSKSIGYIDVSQTTYVKYFREGLADVFNNLARDDGDWVGSEYKEGYNDGFDYGLLLRGKK
jgi:hypothetical protein